MSREELPRVYELRDLIDNLSAPSAYFQDFDHSLREDTSKKQVWLAREREFERLDHNSWTFLINEARPYLTKRDVKGRGWQQLIAILNQARAHNFLAEIGCSKIRFIPRDKRKSVETPDVEGEANGRKVLCEVKTLSISNFETSRRFEGAVGSTSDRLDMGFFTKLMCSLAKANQEMEAYDASAMVRRIAYIVVDFDDLLAEYKVDYFEQIDHHLSGNKVPDLEVVFHNQKTCFHAAVAMQNATVVNEPG